RELDLRTRLTRIRPSHDGAIVAASLAGDGVALSTLADSGAVRVWPAGGGVLLPAEPETLHRWLDAATDLVAHAAPPRAERWRPPPSRNLSGSSFVSSSEVQMSVRSDVVIVGGGLAGLTAACYLARAGREVELLERASAIGGRAATRRKGDFSLNLGPHA